MQRLSARKQLGIVRLYLGGFSYDEIATRTGVSKGSVANVVSELKAGQILDLQGPAEQLELLRELSIDVRRHQLTLGQAVVGLTALSRLQELGIQPSDIESWAAMCRELATNDTEAQAFMQAALALEQIRERTGLSAEALEEKARTMEEEVARLEPIAQELERCPQELDEMKKRRQNLANEIGQLEKRYKPLHQSVTQKERREAELFRRVQGLEEKAQAADQQLAAARRDLKALAELGLSLDELPGFVQRLSRIAQRHGIQPKVLQERLLHELEVLEAGMGLESCLKKKRDELNEVEQAIATAHEEHKALDSVLQKLKQEQAALRMSISAEEVNVHEEIKAMAKITTEATAKLTQDLGNGVLKALLEVQKLRDQSVELGQELGQFEAMIEANEWLRNLMALVKGDSDASASQVRVVALLVLRGVNSWLEQNQKDTELAFRLRTQLRAAIEEFVQWNV